VRTSGRGMDGAEARPAAGEVAAESGLVVIR